MPGPLLPILLALAGAQTQANAQGMAPMQMGGQVPEQNILGQTTNIGAFDEGFSNVSKIVGLMQLLSSGAQRPPLRTPNAQGRILERRKRNRLF